MDTEIASQQTAEENNLDDNLDTNNHEGVVQNIKTEKDPQIREENDMESGDIMKENTEEEQISNNKKKDESEQDVVESDHSCVTQKSDENNENELNTEANENIHDEPLEIRNTEEEVKDPNCTEEDTSTEKKCPFLQREEELEVLVNRLNALEEKFPEKLSINPPNSNEFLKMKICWFELRFVLERNKRELFLLQTAHDSISLCYCEYRKCFEVDDYLRYLADLGGSIDQNSENRLKLAVCVHQMELEDKNMEKFTTDIRWFEAHSIQLFDYLSSSGDSVKKLGYYMLVTSQMKIVVQARMTAYIAKMRLLNFLRLRFEAVEDKALRRMESNGWEESVNEVQPPVSRSSYCCIL